METTMFHHKLRNAIDVHRSYFTRQILARTTDKPGALLKLHLLRWIAEHLLRRTLDRGLEKIDAPQNVTLDHFEVPPRRLEAEILTS